MSYFIPLLSGKAIDYFSPEEFKAHVRALKIEPPPKKIREIKIRPPFVIGKTPKGKLSLKINRKPKWLSEEEMKQISRDSGEPLSELFLKMKRQKIRISTLDDETKIKLEIDSIPF